MSRRILPVIKYFTIFLLFFIVQKPIFVLYNHSMYPNCGIKEIWSIIRAGFSMDISMACYITAIPLLFSILTIYFTHTTVRNLLKIYSLIIAAIVSILYVIDMGLFSYWEFRLDATPIFYFISSPKSALASGLWYEYLFALILLLCYSILIYRALCRYALTYNYWIVPTKKKIGTTILLLLCGGLLFLGIRGGWTVSTMNTARAYFSDNDKLNQAAINPIFSLIESVVKGDKLDKQYQFYSLEEAKSLVAKLYQREDKEVALNNVLKVDRPDIYIIVLESFSTALMESVEDGVEVTPVMNQLAKESVYFSNFYANSFRTDRGLTAILSGYPAQPSTSILKYPRKISKLPGLASTLKKHGYQLNYYYGGDINFTNVKAYLKYQGFEHIISDSDFPISEQLSKWGVHDHFVFERAEEMIANSSLQSPQLTIIQTSSSHEPFEVPFEKFSAKKPNAFAYTDHCIGQFIDTLKASDKWDNSLVILIPDHYGAYPEHIEKYEEMRYKIPMIWTGGAITAPYTIDTIGSQIDIATTLLSQLGIADSTLIFGNNILDSNAAHFAYISNSNLMGIFKKDTKMVLNLTTDDLMLKVGSAQSTEQLKQEGKAFLQLLYQDLAHK